MKVTRTELPEVLILEPKVYRDERGQFFEGYNRRTFREATGLEVEFVQDNESISARNVLRGLHYQIKQPQGKLVRVIAGEIYDVAVDLRRSSPTFGKWTSAMLSPGTRPMIWIPAGFARSSATRRPTTTRPSTSARSPGTTAASACCGRSRGSP
jgi:dTDP-4-dehydrorhamnose 3,5-epimerase